MHYRGRSGQGLVELAFILVLIVAMCLVTLTHFGSTTSNTVSNVTNRLP
jgi:hypothetical protein